MTLIRDFSICQVKSGILLQTAKKLTAPLRVLSMYANDPELLGAELAAKQHEEPEDMGNEQKHEVKTCHTSEFHSIFVSPPTGASPCQGRISFWGVSFFSSCIHNIPQDDDVMYPALF